MKIKLMILCIATAATFVSATIQAATLKELAGLKTGSDLGSTDPKPNMDCGESKPVSNTTKDGDFGDFGYDEVITCRFQSSCFGHQAADADRCRAQWNELRDSAAAVAAKNAERNNKLLSVCNGQLEWKIKALRCPKNKVQYCSDQDGDGENDSDPVTCHQILTPAEPKCTMDTYSFLEVSEEFDVDLHEYDVDNGKCIYQVDLGTFKGGKASGSATVECNGCRAI